MTRVAVTGAAGRMGQMVIAALAEQPHGLRLAAAVERPGHVALGQEVAPGVVVGDNLRAALAAADVYVDFTHPETSIVAAELAAGLGVAAVIGTTGLDADARGAIERASARVPVVLSPNFSLGVNLLCLLAEQAARALGPAFDLEVVELHHRAKRDAPSGTALLVAEALARGHGVRLAEVQRFARAGDVGPRPAGEIGIVAVRGGDVVGEHTAHLLGPEERLELTHRASSRAVFARGAVRAASWLAGRTPGLYGMKDVLGL